MEKNSSDCLYIGGRDLTLEDIASVSRSFRPVQLDEKARQRVTLSREIVERLKQDQVKVYGLNTGFASSRDILITGEKAKKLSKNLIKSHAAGVGRPYSEDVVRGSMLVRAHTLAQGNSGVRPELIDAILSMLNNNIYPYVPQQGSCGSSGDLAPLSHLFLVAIGDNDARVHRRCLQKYDEQYSYEGCRSNYRYIATPLDKDFISCTLFPLKGDFSFIELKEKEGLACNNGTVFSAVITALAAYDAGQLLNTADLCAALSYEAIQAVPDCLDEEIINSRPHPGHATSASNLREALAGSALVYSFHDPEETDHNKKNNGPCGFNLAHFNRALAELHKLNQRDFTGVNKEQLQELIALMKRHQKEDIWEKIFHYRQEQARENKLCPKEQELKSCRLALAEVLSFAQTLIITKTGNADFDESFFDIYSQHIRKIVYRSPQVQDNYAIRATATVHGAVRDTLSRTRETIEIELNSTTDNPIILLKRILRQWYIDHPQDNPEELPKREEFTLWLSENRNQVADQVKSAANFHGEPVGLVADHLSAAIAEVGNITERRIALMVDGNHSKGLPTYLTWEAGLNSGFMIPQYTAASIVSENKIAAMPASVDSIPTGANCEDHVSMSTTAARKCAQVIGNVEKIVAWEMLSAYQALQFRKPAKLGAKTSKLENFLSQQIGPHFLRLNDEWREKVGQHSEYQSFTDAFLHSGQVRDTSFFYHLLEQEMRQQLENDLGLDQNIYQSIQPCMLDDVTFYPLHEVAYKLIQQGDIARLW